MLLILYKTPNIPVVNYLMENFFELFLFVPALLVENYKEKQTIY